MLLIRSVSRMIERTSPTGLIIGGAILALSIPTVRRALRSTAVSVVAGALTLSERIQNMVASGREGLEDVMIEAKMSQIAGDMEISPIEEQSADHMNM